MYADSIDLEFADPTAIDVLYRPDRDYGAVYAVLPGAALKWCTMLISEQGDARIPLVFAENRLVTSIEGVAAEVSEAALRNSDSGSVTELRVYGEALGYFPLVCRRIAVHEAGDATYTVRIGGLQREVPIRVVEPEEVVSMQVRHAPTSPLVDGFVLRDVHVDSLAEAPSLDSVRLRFYPSSPYHALLLELADGTLALGGASVLQAGPPEVVTLDDYFYPTYSSPEAGSYFRLRAHGAGEGVLTGELGSAQLNLPIIVAEGGAGSGGAAGAAGSVGQPSGAGGASGAGGLSGGGAPLRRCGAAGGEALRHQRGLPPRRVRLLRRRPRPARPARHRLRRPHRRLDLLRRRRPARWRGHLRRRRQLEEPVGEPRATMHAWRGVTLIEMVIVVALVGLLVGPLFVVAEVGFALGLAKSLEAQIEERSGPTRVGRPAPQSAAMR